MDELIRKYSEIFDAVPEGEFEPLEDLADSFAYKNILRGIATGQGHFAHLELPRTSGFLFSGRRGSGKHTLANALMQSICKGEAAFDSSSSIRFRAEDFQDAKRLKEGAARDTVEAAFAAAELHAQQGPTFLVFDEMDKYESPECVLTAIADCFAAAEENVYLICITEDEAGVSRELADWLFECRCILPTEDQRREYFEKNLTWNVDDWTSDEESEEELQKTIEVSFTGYDLDDAAQDTEGYTYGDLNKLVMCFRAEAAAALRDVHRPDIAVKLDKSMAKGYIEAFRPRISMMQGGFAGGFIGAMQQNFPGAAQNGAQSDAERLLKRKPEDLTLDEKRQAIFATPTLSEKNMNG